MSKIWDVVISFMGMLVVMGAASGVDRWLRLLRVHAGMTVGISPWWVATVGKFCVMGMCVLLFWFVNCKSERNVVISTIFSVTGLLLLFYNIIAPETYIFQISQHLSPTTLLMTVAAFVAATGVFGLLVSAKKSFEKPGFC